MFLSATQTPCVHEFLNVLGSVAFNIFADNFIVFIFYIFHSERSFGFLAIPLVKKVLPFEWESLHVIIFH